MLGAEFYFKKSFQSQLSYAVFERPHQLTWTWVLFSGQTKMLPLKDENSTSHFPLITIVLMVCNITIFTSSLQDRRVFNSNIVNYGLVPSHLIDSPWLASLTVISSMFIYTGWNHLLENMLYLWVFGKNTEDILGMGRYTICYILCGTLAAFCHIAT